MNREQVIPFYRQIANTLRGRISNGGYRPGDLIPSSVELEKAFQVSNITIRKAVRLLAEEGWVEGRRGVGTVVVDRPRAEKVDIRISGNFREWLDSASAKRFPIGQRVLDMGTVRCPDPVAAILGLDGFEDVWRLRRVRTIDGEPVSYHVNFGRPELLGHLRQDHFAGGRSFVEVFEEHCAVHLARMAQRVEATVADMDLADILAIAFGDPMFFVENTYFSGDGEALEVTHLYLRGDRYTYTASIDLDASENPHTVNA